MSRLAEVYPADRITNVQNAIDTRWLTDAISRFPAGAVEDLRAHLGIEGRNIVTFC